MRDASVVVVTYNALPWIEQSIESVQDEEVVVVDNGSTDGTVEVVRELFPRTRLIERENLGLASGWNAGMAVVTGRYFLLLNADAWLTDGSLARLVEFADAHPEAAVVGPRLLNTDGTLQRSVRGFPTLWRLATEYFFLRKLAPGSQLFNAFYAGGFEHDEEREVEVVMGACMLVRREAVEQVGPLDDAFFLFSEETDWCYRFEQAGWKVLFFPGAECVHVGGASHGGRMFRENVRGHLRFLAKHRGVPLRRARAAAARLVAAAACAAVPRRARRGCIATPPTGLRRVACRSCSSDDPAASRARDRHSALAGGGGRPRARAAGRIGHPRLVARASLRGAGRHLRRRRRRSRWRSSCLLGAGVVALPFARRAPRPERIPGGGGCSAPGVGARRAALARRGRDRRRRPLPPGARPQAGGVRLPLARGGRGVRRRRPAPGLRLPALARLSGARRPRRLPRSVRGRPARGLRARAARASRRLRGRLRALPARRAGGRGRVRPGGRDGACARSRRRLHGAGPARDGVAPAARSRGDRPRLRLRRAAEPAACSHRSPPRASSWRSIHPTYAIFLWLPFAGFLVVRSLAAREEFRRIAVALAALVLPAAAFFAWLLPVVRDTASHAPRRRPSCTERSSSTRGSSTSRPTRATGSHPRSSAGRARSRSSRSCPCRSPGSRFAGAGPPTCSAASSQSRR